MESHPSPGHHAFHLSKTSIKWILIGFALLFIVRLGLIIELPFTDTTEARYAEIARKMVETNDWITPQFDYGVPFWGKPPLHTWVSAIGIKLFGVNGFGARIGIFLTAIAIIIGLIKWAQSIKGRDYAIAGAFIIASNILFYLSSANVMTDLIMIAGTTLAMAIFWSSLHQEHYPRWKKYLFFVGLAIGMLAKGPVAVVLCAAPIGLWVLLTNRWIDTWKKIPWITGLLLTTLLSVPWYYLAEQKTPGFLHYFIVGEHYQRFVDSGWKGDLYGHGHAHAKGAIWLNALGAFLPWTPFLIWPLLRIKRVISGMKSETNKWTLYLVCWAISPMLFFTMATNILATYVLPGIPAMGFLALELWQKSSSQNENQPTLSSGALRFYTASGALAVSIGIIALIGITWNPHIIEHRTQMFLVQKVKSENEKTPDKDGKLFYWHKRYYSAEFYTQGKTKVIQSPEDIQNILSNNSRDFLAIRKKYISHLPFDLESNFSQVANFKKNIILYREKQTPVTQ